jgi:hypothetical protein
VTAAQSVSCIQGYEGVACGACASATKQTNATNQSNAYARVGQNCSLCDDVLTDAGYSVGIGLMVLVGFGMYTWFALKHLHNLFHALRAQEGTHKRTRSTVIAQLANQLDGVTFVSTVTGFSKATFKGDVKKAYIAGVGALASVAIDTIKIYHLVDGTTAAPSQVAFDVEIAAASPSAATALLTKVASITDADLLTSFTDALVEADEHPPAGLDVDKTGAVADDISVFSIMASMADFMIYVGTLSTVKLSWSDTLHNTLVWATVASGTQVTATKSLSCLLVLYTPGQRVLLSIMALAVSGPIAVMLIVFLANWKFGSSARSAVLGYPLVEWRQTSVLVAAVLYQPTVAKLVFALFPLVEIDGTQYMVDDMSVTEDGWLRSDLTCAIPIVIVYVLGLPALLFKVLRSDNYSRSDLLAGLAFMFKSFKPEQKYWAVVVMLRKTAMAVLVAWPGVQQPWNQIYVATWIMVLSTISHAIWVPYAHPKLQRIELCSLSAATAIFAMALYMPIDIDGLDSSFNVDIYVTEDRIVRVAIMGLTWGAIVAFVTLICRNADVDMASALNSGRSCCRGAGKFCFPTRTAALPRRRGSLEDAKEKLMNPAQARNPKPGLVSNDRGVRWAFASAPTGPDGTTT